MTSSDAMKLLYMKQLLTDFTAIEGFGELHIVSTIPIENVAVRRFKDIVRRVAIEMGLRKYLGVAYQTTFTRYIPLSIQ